MSTWSVAADDRTGALEVGGLLAAALGPVTVSVGSLVGESGVVDLGTRAMSAQHAAQSAGRFDDIPVRHRFHKIDSTLRGNWVAELRARTIGHGRLVLLAAWPELGRTCTDGVVKVHGRPIGALRDHMPELEILSDVAALRQWLINRAEESRWVACDIATTDEMRAFADVLVDGDCLVAGPAGPLAAAVAAHCRAGVTGTPAPQDPFCVPTLAAAMVVCGSANPVALEQLARLRRALPDVCVVATPPVVGALSVAAARRLADEARTLLDERRPELLVIVGGDTAAALLGDAPRTAAGMAAPGMPWSRAADGAGPVVVTKAGGFGDPDTLVRLLCGEIELTGDND